MKKAFTFLIALVFVCAAFAQTGKYEITGMPVNNDVPRSNWYGWYTHSSYVHVQAAESEYQLFIPAGTFNSTVTLEQVRFYAIPSENINNYTGDPFTLDVDFIVRIYSGSSVNGVDFNPGQLAYTQVYNPLDAGDQVVTLTTPFTVNPNDNVTIGIYCADRSAMGLCDDDPTCAGLNFANWPDYGDGFHHYYWTAGNPAWAYENANVQEHDPWTLSVFYNDGNGYQSVCDWKSHIYDPNDAQTYPDDITSLYLDQYTDSVYFYGGAFNYGIDSSYGIEYIDIYVDGETPFYFMEHEPLTTEAISHEQNYGFRYGPVGFIAVEEMADYGISFPFTMCFEVTYEPDASYPSSDPNLDNNRYCVEYTNVEPIEPGINENTNGLNVYPNPACNFISIENVSGAQISIFNIAGQEVMAIESANANETINIANLTEGVYVVRVVNGNEVATSKVSIVR